MMAAAHIQCLATYRPERRLLLSDVGVVWGLEGAGEIRVAGPDEDAVTLAVSAAAALPAALLAACTTVILARPIGAEGSGDGAAVVAMALGLPAAIRTFEVTGSDRCFLSALEVAAAFVRASADDAVLVVAGDDTRVPPGSPAERRHGHAGAAAVVSARPGAAEFLGSASVSVPVPDRWFGPDWARRDGGERFIATTVAAEAMAALRDTNADGVRPADRLLVALPERRLADRLAAAAARPHGADPAAWDHGTPGAALPAILLAHAIADARPGERIDIVAFGSGATRLSVEVSDPAAVSNVVPEPGPAVSYSTFLRSAGSLGPPLSAPVASPVPATRDIGATLGLLGGMCDACGATYYPSRPACASCGSNVGLRSTRLVGPATVITSTTDHLVAGVNPGTPESPTTMVVAETSSGARVFLPAVHGYVPDVGETVTSVLRLAHLGGGFRNYHWRYAPCRSSEM
jgi:hydroxymethylglutaryl-CoA synthase